MSDLAISQAEIVLHCQDLTATLNFFKDRLGFRIITIYPADDPAIVEMSGYGLSLRLQRSDSDDATLLRLICDPLPDQEETSLTAPNGTVIELVSPDADLVLPPLKSSLVISRTENDNTWIAGRAGMQYRDLIPDRQGGRFIASHIRIPDGGPVPDYVHYHKIRFQMIYCYRGWVKVVYEDQGEPFVMHAGDCVLQPPQIRHRVLESSPGLEVVEIGCPAEHHTCVDHDLNLPTTSLNPTRDFSGQRFVRHKVDEAIWQPWEISGFEARDLGIETATQGLAAVKVSRLSDSHAPMEMVHSHELLFWFVLEGSVDIELDQNRVEKLEISDAITIPAGMGYCISHASNDAEILEVRIPKQT